MTDQRLAWWLSWPLAIAAYVVMPDGPWYRQAGAGFLIALASHLLTYGRGEEP